MTAPADYFELSNSNPGYFGQNYLFKRNNRPVAGNETATFFTNVTDVGDAGLTLMSTLISCKYAVDWLVHRVDIQP
jgi:hypothetical protein